MQEKYQKSTKLEKYLIAFALGLYLQIFLRISETYYFAAGNSKTEFESLLRQDRAVTEKSYAHTADGIGNRQRKPPFVLLESVRLLPKKKPPGIVPEARQRRITVPTL